MLRPTNTLRRGWTVLKWSISYTKDTFLKLRIFGVNAASLKKKPLHVTSEEFTVLSFKYEFEKTLCYEISVHKSGLAIFEQGLVMLHLSASLYFHCCIFRNFAL